MEVLFLDLTSGMYGNTSSEDRLSWLRLSQFNNLKQSSCSPPLVTIKSGHVWGIEPGLRPMHRFTSTVFRPSEPYSIPFIPSCIVMGLCRTQVIESLQEAVGQSSCIVMDTIRAAGIDVTLHFRKKHDFKSSMGTHLP